MSVFKYVHLSTGVCEVGSPDAGVELRTVVCHLVWVLGQVPLEEQRVLVTALQPLSACLQ